jgi:hypothetical protein
MKLWIARDQNGEIYLYPTKPDKYDCIFDAYDWWQIKKDLFPEVTFENSPMEVELVIKK